MGDAIQHAPKSAVNDDDRAGRSVVLRYQKRPIEVSKIANFRHLYLQPSNMSPTLPVPADPWVSMRHLQRIRAFMNNLGLDADDFLARAGLNRDQLMDGDCKVPLGIVELLFGIFHAHHGDPHFGLHMANEVQPATLGAMGHLLQCCDTLADLIDIATNFNGLLSNIGHTSVVHSPGQFEVRWECLAGSPFFRRHASEYIIGTGHVLTRLLAPGVCAPIEVQFMHARPQVKGGHLPHVAFFGCPVYFNRPQTSVTLPSSMLQIRLPHGDAVLKELLKRHAQYMLERRAGPTSLPKDVRRLVKTLILSGNVTKDAVARQLGLSERSLHRRLEDAGTSYREQIDAVRLDMAREKLTEGQMPISELADHLGFSTSQSFSRWFKTLCDLTPGQYRSGTVLEQPSMAVSHDNAQH